LRNDSFEMAQSLAFCRRNCLLMISSTCVRSNGFFDLRLREMSQQKLFQISDTAQQQVYRLMNCLISRIPSESSLFRSCFFCRIISALFALLCVESCERWSCRKISPSSTVHMLATCCEAKPSTRRSSSKSTSLWTYFFRVSRFLFQEMLILILEYYSY
jgi:hypothetical protein